MSPRGVVAGRAVAHHRCCDGPHGNVGLIASCPTVLLDLRPRPTDHLGSFEAPVRDRGDHLRALLRAGSTTPAIEAAWRAAMWDKPAGHGINTPNFVQPQRSMSAIGGWVTAGTARLIDISVRYFAAARAAAGADSEELTMPEGITVSGLVDELSSRNAELARVLLRCSYLSTGWRCTTRRALHSGNTIDVLPPFAGG